MLFNLFAKYRRESSAYAPVQQAEIVVYLGSGTDCTPWISGGDLLLYGYRRRQPFYPLRFRLGHTPEKLSGVGAKAFNIAALPFRVKGVKCKT